MKKIKKNTKIDKKKRNLIKVTLSTFISGTLFSCDKKEILNKLKNPNSIAKSPIRVNILRPPGAVDEREFAKRCIRCGRCGEVCPYRSIKFFDIKEAGIFTFTPYINVLEKPCYLCMKCVEVCPSGALIPCEKEEVKMGIAVIDKVTCVTWNMYETGMMCKTCFNVCPFSGKALKLDLHMRPYIDENYCTGCGICAYSCIADTYPKNKGKKAIYIMPVRIYKEKKLSKDT
ncbi:MAG TPA: 4Fe-4S dicluster domain-containing protein [Aquificae bacterium]|nr:4Fe-4S dicluster domain-containing protein [Aquificota bacterium]